MVFSEYTKGATSLPADASVRLGGAGVNGALTPPLPHRVQPASAEEQQPEGDGGAERRAISRPRGRAVLHLELPLAVRSRLAYGPRLYFLSPNRQ